MFIISYCRTHRSIPAIDEQHERELYAYIHGYIMRHKAKLYRIGGMPDHIHMLVSIPPTVAVSEFVRGLKFASSGYAGGDADSFATLGRQHYRWLLKGHPPGENINVTKHMILPVSQKSINFAPNKQ